MASFSLQSRKFSLPLLLCAQSSFIVWSREKKHGNADCLSEFELLIERYPDRIELSNPGTIIAGKGQMIHGGLPEPRNKNILKIFNLIGIGEHAGSGVPEIFEVWKTEGLKEPIVEETFGTEIGDRTEVTLPLAKKDQDDYHQDHHQW